MPEKVESAGKTALAATEGSEYHSRLSHTIPDLQVFLRNGYPIGRTVRVLLVLWSLFLCAGFALACYLKPDPRGFGTHQRLGLPPCTFQVLFDIPCPSCGMTTCFAHFTRGELLSASRANIAGVLLATFCLVQIPWCWISAWYGYAWKTYRPVEVTLAIVGVIVGVALVNWLWLVF